MAERARSANRKPGAGAKPNGRRKFWKPLSSNFRATATPRRRSTGSPSAPASPRARSTFISRTRSTCSSRWCVRSKSRRSIPCTTCSRRHDGSTAELLRAQFSFIYQHIVEDKRRREVVRMLIAEARALSRTRRSLSRGNFESVPRHAQGRRSSAASIAAKFANRRSSTRRKWCSRRSRWSMTG